MITNKILEEVIRENDFYHPMGQRAGFPVFHKRRSAYRKDVAKKDLEELTRLASARFREYRFKMNAKGSNVRVSVTVADQEIDAFTFSAREYTNMNMVKSPDGVFAENIEEFMEIVKGVLD